MTVTSKGIGHMDPKLYTGKGMISNIPSKTSFLLDKYNLVEDLNCTTPLPNDRIQQLLRQEEENSLSRENISTLCTLLFRINPNDSGTAQTILSWLKLMARFGFDHITFLGILLDGFRNHCSSALALSFLEMLCRDASSAEYRTLAPLLSLPGLEKMYAELCILNSALFVAGPLPSAPLTASICRVLRIILQCLKVPVSLESKESIFLKLLDTCQELLIRLYANIEGEETLNLCGVVIGNILTHKSCPTTLKEWCNTECVAQWLSGNNLNPQQEECFETALPLVKGILESTTVDAIDPETIGRLELVIARALHTKSKSTLRHASCAYSTLSSYLGFVFKAKEGDNDPRDLSTADLALFANPSLAPIAKIMNHVIFNWDIQSRSLNTIRNKFLGQLVPRASMEDADQMFQIIQTLSWSSSKAKVGLLPIFMPFYSREILKVYQDELQSWVFRVLKFPSRHPWKCQALALLRAYIEACLAKQVIVNSDWWIHTFIPEYMSMSDGFHDTVIVVINKMSQNIVQLIASEIMFFASKNHSMEDSCLAHALPVMKLFKNRPLIKKFIETYGISQRLFKGNLDIAMQVLELLIPLGDEYTPVIARFFQNSMDCQSAQHRQRIQKAFRTFIFHNHGTWDKHRRGAFKEDNVTGQSPYLDDKIFWMEFIFRLPVSSLFPGAGQQRRETALYVLKDLVSESIRALSPLFLESFIFGYGAGRFVDIISTDTYEAHRLAARTILNAFPTKFLSDAESNQLCEDGFNILSNGFSAAEQGIGLIMAFDERQIPAKAIEGLSESLAALQLGSSSLEPTVQLTIRALYALSNNLQIAEDNILLAAKEYPAGGLVELLVNLVNKLGAKRLYTTAVPEQSNCPPNLLLIDWIQILLQKGMNIALAVCGDDSPEGYAIPPCKTQPQLTVDGINFNSQIVLHQAFLTIRGIGHLIRTICELLIREHADVGTEITAHRIEGLADFLFVAIRQCLHRGSFNITADSLSEIALPLLKSKQAPFHQLVSKWLDNLSALVFSGSFATRRSGGLPLAFAALFTSSESHCLLGPTIQKLVSNVNMSDDKISLSGKIHSMNVLRTLMLNSATSDATKPFLSMLMELAIEGFSSPLYRLRNCSLMLFCALSNRVLKHQKDDGGLESDIFFGEYPSLYAIFKRFLLVAADDLERNIESVYPCLSVLVKLSPPASPSKEYNVSEFIPLLRALYSSKAWKIREIAVQCVLTLQFWTVNGYSCALESMLNALAFSKSASSNDSHAWIMELLGRVNQLVSLPATEITEKVLMEIATTCRRFTYLGSEANQCPITKDLWFKLVMDFDQLLIASVGQRGNTIFSSTWMNGLRADAILDAEKAINATSDSPLYNAHRLLLHANHRSKVTILQNDKSKRPFLLSMICSGDSHISIIALKFIREVGESNADIVDAILNQMHRSIQPDHFELLTTTLAWIGTTYPQLVDTSIRIKVMEIIQFSLKTRRFPVPFHLEILGWLAQTCDTESFSSASIFINACMKASEPSEPIPSRVSTALAVASFLVVKLSKLPSLKPKDAAQLYILVDRLLVDDDEETRDIACAVFQTTASLARGTLFKAWEALLSDAAYRQAMWTEILSTLRPLKNAESLLACEQHKMQVLFEADPANMFEEPIARLYLFLDMLESCLTSAESPIHMTEDLIRIWKHRIEALNIRDNMVQEALFKWSHSSVIFLELVTMYRLSELVLSWTTDDGIKKECNQIMVLIQSNPRMLHINELSDVYSLPAGK